MAVNLVKSNPVVRHVRLHLRSSVLFFTDVVQRRDGTVWYVERWRSVLVTPHAEWKRVRRAFDAAVEDRVDMEERGGYLARVRAHEHAG